MKIGDFVTGELFEKGVVVAMGTLATLRQHDHSGACEDLEDDVEMVLVELHGGSDTPDTLYCAEEVWEAA